MAKLAGSLERYPARVSLYWYTAALAVGTALLCLPASSAQPDAPIRFMDAWFTAASALCVTGLTVRSTGNDFTFFGQIVILSLIQVGGIGIMTITTLVMSQIVGTGLRHRAVVSETLGATGPINLRWILASVVVVTLGCELLGAALLFARFIADMPMWDALWYAVFHSISAFCNAGFQLRDDGMIQFQGDVVVNLSICLLIVLGGLGFPVLIDANRAMRHGWREVWNELHLHSKLTIIGTALLLSSGAVLFLALEWNQALGGFPWINRVLAPIFYSVSCRTAGFNSVDVSGLSSATLFISILLMLVGAGSCSTAGGIKVSTVAMLVSHAATRFAGSKHVNICRRTIPQPAIDRALASTMIYLFVAGVGIMLLLVFDRKLEVGGDPQRHFLDVAFECVSALGTVGLSTGVTPRLSDWGRIIIIGLMFLGRLGPITFFAALARTTVKSSVEFANEEPLIG
jgi:trk system potassium uptake protein TrkH